MLSENVNILDNKTVQQKLLRMAYEIWEKHVESGHVYICGIEGPGTNIAKILFQTLKEISTLDIHFVNVIVDKKNPLGNINLDTKIPTNANIILVDDVANTGRILFHTIAILAELKPKKVEIAVLVNRMHKAFPIQPNYIGQNMSTTLQDHIFVEQDQNGKFVVYLK